MQAIKLGQSQIDRTTPPYLVAEIGLNHNGDLEIGKKTIQAAAKAGAKAVKFQSYKTEEFIDSKTSEAKFLYDIFKEYELNEEMHRAFQRTAKDEGVEFFSTPLDSSSVDLLVSLNVPALKIASGDIVNKELLTKCLSTGLPLIVSTGATLPFEVQRALDFFSEKNFTNLALLHCVSMYPTPPNKANLRNITYFLDNTDFPIGFSDHTDGTLAAGIAVGLGASIIEKHFTLSKNLAGPDHGISSDPSELKTLASTISSAYEMRGEKGLKRNKEELDGWFFGRRSLFETEKGWIAKRPALHLKDNTKREAWDWNLKLLN